MDTASDKLISNYFNMCQMDKLNVKVIQTEQSENIIFNDNFMN